VLITSENGFDTFFPQVTGHLPSGELDMMHTIVCKFGEFGVVPATFNSKTQILTLSPETHLHRDELSEKPVDL
jgi:hypothetical protein